MTAGLYITRNFLNPLLSNLADPDKEKHEQARRQAKAHLERLNRRKNADGLESNENSSEDRAKVEDLVLNEYENLVALEMVAPEDIHVGFDGMNTPLYIPCSYVINILTQRTSRHRWLRYDH